MRKNGFKKISRNKLFPNLTVCLFIVLGLTLGCGPSARYQRQPVLLSGLTAQDEFRVIASYYGKKFHGKKTASGEIFDMYEKTAAHRRLPFGTMLEVTNRKVNKSVIVRINDRGPFVDGRELDLSYEAARQIDLIRDGYGYVYVKIIRLGKD